MAERRMFAKTIIDSDAFLDMPLSTQALYFHLSMRADDDGFINNPKKIARMIGADDDSLKLLIMKKFIIPFDSGIVVIKHWRIHNYIQKDRYKQTVYQEERAKLTVKENGAYTENSGSVYMMDTECIQDAYSLDTQVRIGKDRIGKDRIENSADKPQQSDTEIQYVVDAYHSICLDLPKIRTLTKQRRSDVKARITENGIDTITEAFRKAQASDFLTGKVTDFKASFDWIMKPSNFCKILEGNYDNRPTPAAAARPANNEPQRSSSIEFDDIALLVNQF